MRQPNERTEVLARLQRELPGRNLYALAELYGVTVQKDGKLNKGWVGQTIERAAGLSTDSRRVRDGADFELKTTILTKTGTGWRPRETIKITVMNPFTILEEPFAESALWNKLERLILVGYVHPDPSRCEAVQIRPFDFLDPKLTGGVRSFWEEIRTIVAAGEIADYNSQGSSGGFLQLRPTGNRHVSSTCPITGRLYQAQAFYATKGLVKTVLGI